MSDELRRAAEDMVMALSVCTLLKGESQTMDVERCLYKLRKVLRSALARPSPASEQVKDEPLTLDALEDLMCGLDVTVGERDGVLHVWHQELTEVHTAEDVHSLIKALRLRPVPKHFDEQATLTPRRRTMANEMKDETLESVLWDLSSHLYGWSINSTLPKELRTVFEEKRRNLNRAIARMSLQEVLYAPDPDTLFDELIKERDQLQATVADLREKLKSAEYKLRSHAPDGHSVTNREFVEMKAELAAKDAEIARLKADYPGGDQEAQARAWSFVWRELENAGMLSHATPLESGRDRAVSYIRHMASEIARLKQSSAETIEAMQLAKQWLLACQDHYTPFPDMDETMVALTAAIEREKGKG